MSQSELLVRVWMARLVCAFALCLVLFSSSSGRVRAQSAVTFGPTQVENRFPTGLQFEVVLPQPAAEIESARFIFDIPTVSGTVVNQREARSEMDGDSIRLNYLWAVQGYPPGVRLNFHWEVTLADESKISSPDESTLYTDPNYEWIPFEQSQFSLFCHDRDYAFCQNISYLASKAIPQQTAFYHSDYPGPFRVWVYNSLDEMKEWNGDMYDYIGGFAFPEEGVIAVIVSPENNPENWAWVNSVIPHELSHLILNWKTTNGLVDVPTWLDEGSAVYNEMIDKSDYVRYFKKMIKYETIVPIAQLDLNIHAEDAEVSERAYVQSFMIVSYILDVYGESGYLRLLDAYKHSLAGDDAFYNAFRQNLTEFEAGWREWVEDPEQAKAAVVQTSAAYALTPGSTPTRFRTITLTPTAYPTWVPTRTPTPTATVTPTAAPSQTLQPTPTPVPAASNGLNSRTVWIVLGTCLLGMGFGAVVLAGAGAAAFVARKRR